MGFYFIFLILIFLKKSLQVFTLSKAFSLGLYPTLGKSQHVDKRPLFYTHTHTHSLTHSLTLPQSSITSSALVSARVWSLDPGAAAGGGTSLPLGYSLLAFLIELQSASFSLSLSLSLSLSRDA